MMHSFHGNYPLVNKLHTAKKLVNYHEKQWISQVNLQWSAATVLHSVFCCKFTEYFSQCTTNERDLTGNKYL